MLDILLHLFGEGRCCVGNATKEIWKSWLTHVVTIEMGIGDRKGETDLQGLWAVRRGVTGRVR